MEAFRPNLWTTDDSEGKNRSNAGEENEAVDCFGANGMGTRMDVVRCCRTFPSRKQTEEVEGPTVTNTT